MWFWWKNGLNDIADTGDVNAVTRRVNGGYNGLDSRKKYLVRAKEALGI
jgi:putative chitinase